MTNNTCVRQELHGYKWSGGSYDAARIIDAVWRDGETRQWGCPPELRGTDAPAMPVLPNAVREPHREKIGKGPTYYLPSAVARKS